ncbi:acyltransferase family protein [Amnibacterium endophyticum]|uniref:Acyltransferase family protein n=1 Tax=Amnibacterium endophyticum TaxID=2109337 RepID=A0ABW4L997_9MICO
MTTTVAETGIAARPVVRRRNRERLLALDGLRGVAAFVVVLHHLMLIALPVSGPSGEPVPFTGWWWLERTPLKLLTAGREAVVVFFVLSGLVVVLPALKRVDFSWPGLIASRFVRLFLPAWAAIAFASLLLVVVPRVPQQVTGGSWLARQVPHDWTWPTLVGQWSLMIGGVPQNNVLWTLRWELAFSLVLPAFVVLAALLGRWWLPTGVLALGLAVAGTVGGIDALGYLPIFFLGTLIAVRLLSLERWSETRSARRVLAVVLPISAVVLVLEFLLAPVVPQGTDAAHAVRGIELLGAVGIVVCAAGATRFRTVLEGPVPQFLGRISFSLYLVHLPILATLAFLLGDWNWPVVGAIGVPLALLSGWGFYRLVEKPLHRVARRAKKNAARLVEDAVRAGRR